jgi:hypothetical protein
MTRLTYVSFDVLAKDAAAAMMKWWFCFVNIPFLSMLSNTGVIMHVMPFPECFSWRLPYISSPCLQLHGVGLFVMYLQGSTSTFLLGHRGCFWVVRPEFFNFVSVNERYAKPRLHM